MGMYINDSNFSILEDGAIVRCTENNTLKSSPNDLNVTILNIIRLGANSEKILAAYKARKKCYSICRRSTKRSDFKEYVNVLLLDNYPNELKKAELGKTYLRQLWFLLGIIVGPVVFLLMILIMYVRMKEIAEKIKNI